MTRLLKLLVSALSLLAVSCRTETDDRALQQVSCRPSVPAPPSIPSAKTWTRTPFKVEPKGVYTKRSLQDTLATLPTSVDVARGLKLTPGDYVGLQAFGKWYWGADTSPTGPTSQRLGAVFVDAQGKPLSPAKSGQNAGFATPPTYHDNLSTDIPEDFEVPASQEVVVRVPAGAVRILFGVGDSAYGDNSTAGEFGVMVFEPNRKSSEPVVTLIGLDIEEAEEMFSEAEIARLLALDPPEAKAFSSSPFSGPAGSETSAQWRGNYGGKGWAPLRSTYGAKRDTNSHWGWDIFAPKGSSLVAPVWPSYMSVPASGTDYGNTVVFAFKANGKKYLLAYAHLNAVEGQARSITGPEVVGYAGCSGSSVDATGCGKRYESGKSRGMRNDHVHVGLFREGTTTAADKFACDPRSFLNWTIR